MNSPHSQMQGSCQDADEQQSEIRIPMPKSDDEDLDSLDIELGMDHQNSCSSGRSRELQMTLSDPKLLRAVRVDSLLSGRGEHLRGASPAARSFTDEEAEKLYGHSRQVKAIKDFVSHSWGASGWAKYRALCLFYNGIAAAAISCLAASLACIVSIVYPLPGFYIPYGKEKFADYSPLCLTVGTLTFLLILETWHRMPAFLNGNKNTSIFFDKLCVHQYDHELKLAGINSFAAVIAKSERIILLWSGKYFQRLWCTLEIAALVHKYKRHAATNQARQLPLVMIPLALSDVCLKGFVCMFILLIISNASVVFSWTVGAPRYATQLAIPGLSGATCFVYLTHALRSYMRERLALRQQMTSFNVNSAQCCSDEDRELVLATICKWFGSLADFDKHVHTTVHDQVTSSIGRDVDFPLRFQLMIALPWCFNAMDHLAVWIRNGTTGEIIAKLMSHIVNVPLTVCVCLVLARLARCTSRSDLRPACDIAITIAVGIIGWSMWVTIWGARMHVSTSLAGAGISLGSVVVLAVGLKVWAKRQ
eukprot:TRINITY_DN65859_c0_g1_i1.p1 TRINITY_DN65859_c0_g1~~TRINITY_DN65859_c0_g1_i1.p1  ORF type:complete len:534 (-),score=42.93 TRINITY_DN65859_c0_g1_i1:295-1896(-)